MSLDRADPCRLTLRQDLDPLADSKSTADQCACYDGADPREREHPIDW
jgi:hypothetical protein